MEILSDFDKDTYRGIYAYKLGAEIYVLHAFKKESKIGKKIPRETLAVINNRLKRARELAHA